MPNISFIYKINDTETKYGKYVANYISDDHDGLDIMIKHVLLDTINLSTEKNLPRVIIKRKDIKVGILNCSSAQNYFDYSTRQEHNMFDFYYYLSDYGHLSYLDQKLVYFNSTNDKKFNMNKKDYEYDSDDSDDSDDSNDSNGI